MYIHFAPEGSLLNKIQIQIWEFRSAFENDVDRGKKRLAAILLDPITDFDENNRIVKQYVSTHTYLDIAHEQFLAKMLFTINARATSRPLFIFPI